MPPAICKRPECGKTLPPRHHRGNPRRWCSEACRRKVERVARARLDPETARKAMTAHREWRTRVGYTDSIRAADQRRRARKLAVPNDNIVAREIFDRDSWHCGICTLPVDADLVYPDPKCASLDHIIPLSRGGSHTEDNVRCAHLDCNVKRGARLDVGLLAS